MFSSKRMFYKISITLLALAVAFAGAGIASQPAQAQECTQWHTVQRGEYLVQIGRLYGVHWRTLAEMNNLQNPSLVFPGQRLCVAPVDAVIPETGAPGAAVPMIRIINVVEDRSVTISTRNFPANVRFNVLMGEIGTRGIGGIRVDQITTPGGGDFTATFNIPQALRGERQIAIRLDSPTTNFFSFNFFSNTTLRHGVDPDRPRVVAPALPGDPIATRGQRVVFGQPADIFLGNGGLFMDSSNYTGTVVVGRHATGDFAPPRDTRFVQAPVAVRVFDHLDNRIDRVFGLNYLYFNLNQRTRAALDAGELNIYQHTGGANWVPCPVQILIDTKNRPHGRAACVLSSFGVHALAIDR